MQPSLLKKDMVGQLLQRTSTPKLKKLKNTAKLVDNVDLGILHLEIPHPSTQKEITQATMSDFEVDKIDLGPHTRDRDVQIF